MNLSQPNDLEKLWHVYLVVDQGNWKEHDGTFIICLEPVQINSPHTQLSRALSHGLNILQGGEDLCPATILLLEKKWK